MSFMHKDGEGSKNGQVCICGLGSNWQYHLLRWIFGIVIIFIVFWVGMQVGEIKSSLEGGSGFSRHMRGSEPMNMMYDQSGYGGYGAGSMYQGN